MSAELLVKLIHGGDHKKACQLIANPRFDVNGVCSGFPLLHVAVDSAVDTASAALKILSALLGRSDLNVAQTTYHGFPAIYIATQDSEHAAALKLLLQHPRIDVNQATVGDGSTPLCKACLDGNVVATRLLLAHPRIDPNKCKKTGFNPLLLATQGSHAECVRLLLEPGRGTNVNHSDRDAVGKAGAGVFALLQAVEHDNKVRGVCARNSRRARCTCVVCGCWGAWWWSRCCRLFTRACVLRWAGGGLWWWSSWHHLDIIPCRQSWTCSFGTHKSMSTKRSPTPTVGGSAR
jgi:hypothetical protein